MYRSCATLRARIVPRVEVTFLEGRSTRRRQKRSAPALRVIGGQFRVDFCLGQPDLPRLRGGACEQSGQLVIRTRANQPVDEATHGLTPARVRERGGGRWLDRESRSWTPRSSSGSGIGRDGSPSLGGRGSGIEHRPGGLPRQGSRPDLYLRRRRVRRRLDADGAGGGAGRRGGVGADFASECCGDGDAGRGAGESGGLIVSRLFARHHASVYLKSDGSRYGRQTSENHG